MATLSIGINETEFADLKRSLSHKQIQAARYSAVSETVRHLRTHISREVRKVLNLKKSQIDPRIVIKRMPRRGDMPVGVLEVARAAVPLRDFPHSYTDRLARNIVVRTQKSSRIARPDARESKGVAVKVFRDQRRERLKGTFIIARFGAHIFERALPGSKGFRKSPAQKRAGRSPVGTRYGPTVLGVIAGRSGFLEKLIRKASDFLDRRFASKLQYIHSGGRVGRNPQVVISEPSE